LTRWLGRPRLGRWLRGPVRQWQTRRGTGGRARPDAAGSGGGTTLSGIRFLVAGEAAARMADAMDHNRPEEAARIQQTLGPLEHQHPRLIEQSVRLALLKGRTAAALDLLERHSAGHPRLRLLLQVVRLAGGQKAVAHLDLHDWARSARCPEEAVALLAWLEWEASQPRAAAERLAHFDPWRAGPAVRQLQLLLALETGDQPQLLRTLAAAGRLSRPDDWFALFLRGFGLNRRLVTCEPPAEMVDALAVRLLKHPELIPALVRAQRLAARPVGLRLLRRALERLARDAAAPAEVCAAVAELALLEADPDVAADWARRGLNSKPADARLALLLDRAEREAHPERVRTLDPDAHHGLNALRDAAGQHPDYADVRRALVIRYRDAGRNDDAVSAFEQWRATHANHPLTPRMREDLAA